jgi:hypothetical protein
MLQAEILVLLQQTTSEACLNKFLVSRGLRIFTRWLEDIEDLEVKRQLFALLGTLPIATKNVIDTSHIMVDVLAAKESTDAALSATAAKLIIAWETLEAVYVIPKSDAKVEEELVASSSEAFRPLLWQ